MSIVLDGTSGVVVSGNTNTLSGLTVGKGAGSVATNTAVGASALAANTTGDRNVAVGYQSLTSITTSSNNIAVGYQAGLLATGGANVLIGRQAGYGSLSTNYNTFVGDQAGLSATTGERNTFIGAGVGSGTVTGSYNVGVGGYDGGGASTLNAAAFSGSRNTAMGSGALQANTTASYNTAVGYQAGYSSTTANSNTLIGNGAGYSLTTGSNNTFVGPATGSGTSGFYVTTGSKNTILGGYNGNQGGLDIRTASNWVVLSDGDGNPWAGVNNSGYFYANQGLASTPYSNTAQHRFNANVAQGTGMFVISAYPAANEDSVRVFAASGTGYNAAATTISIAKNSGTNRSINAAGTVNASGADYAEYMTKAGDFTIAKGDVVGINADGKLTNVFADAVSFVVKSTDPSYVGGDVWGSKDVIGEEPELPKTDWTEEQHAQYAIEKAVYEAKIEAARQTVDRIAFAGQVPVNVTGATAGQYIIPVNDNGSIKGEAVSNPTFGQYQQAVGKVIAIEQDGRARIIVKVA